MFHGSETIDATPATRIDPSRMQISNSPGAAAGVATGAQLSGAEVIAIDGTVVTVVMSEAQRVQAIATSGTSGGDSLANVVDFEADGAILDSKREL